MREYKFRAWDTFNERMVYDPYFFKPSGPHDKVDDDKRYDAPFQYYEDCRDVEDGISRPCHIMQFIGLKDKNGKEIYEGDVIHYQHSKDSKEYTGEIYYNNNSACFYIKTSDESGFALLGHQKIIEVIGNIYENSSIR